MKSSNYHEPYEDHLSDISSQVATVLTIVAGSATPNTESSTTDSNGDSKIRLNSLSALLGLASVS
jgi:hypothetical protein